jgi:hypothetical protein
MRKTKVNDPYAVSPWERVVDSFVEFWGALLGVRSVIDRPLDSYSGRRMTRDDYNWRSHNSSAWRRERNYERARAALIENELGSIPAPVIERAVLKLGPERYVDWLLTVDADLGNLRPMDLIRSGDVNSVVRNLDAMPAPNEPRRCDRCGQLLPSYRSTC